MSQKIHHLHIRKTGGRSVHSAVFARTGHNGEEIYRFLSKHPGTVQTVGNIKIGAWLSDMDRDFDYSFCHTPFYKLTRMSDDIFMICCLRDPVDRFLSQWKMLKRYIETRASRAFPHVGLEKEVVYFDEDLLRFFEKLPEFHRMNQLYMFSKTGNLAEAVMNMRRMNLILETEDLGPGVKKLFDMQGWQFAEVTRFGASPITAGIAPDVHTQLRQLFMVEYALLDKARAMKAHYAQA